MPTEPPTSPVLFGFHFPSCFFGWKPSILLLTDAMYYKHLLLKNVRFDNQFSLISSKNKEQTFKLALLISFFITYFPEQF